MRVTLATNNQPRAEFSQVTEEEAVEVRFSIFYEHQLPRPWGEGGERRLYENALDQIEIADRVGFDYVWAVEHHFLEEYSHSSAPEVFLAAASQRTKRIRLGHGIVQVLPAVNHPARVAERVATLDLVSGGRVEFGTGEGSSSAELGGFGVQRTEKRAIWQDTVDAVTRMFVEEPFAGWESPYFTMPPRNVIPKTVQKPHPPLWVACSRRETIHLAARNGMGALSFSFVEPEDAAKWVTEYYRLLESEECVPAGFSVNPNVTVVLPMMCHEDERTAIERGIDGAHFFGFALAHYYGTTPHDPGRTNVWDEFVEHRAARGFDREAVIAGEGPLSVNIGSLRGAVGTPDQVADLIRRYEEVGVDQVAFVMQSGPTRHEHICEALELFGKSVIPRFTEGREERDRAKADRLAPAIAAALGRREPARELPAGYRIDEEAEVRRTTKPKQRRSSRDEVRSRIRRRGTLAMKRLVEGRSDAQLERWFGRPAQRVFFAAMSRAFDPAVAQGFTGDIEFRLSQADGVTGTWTIEVRGTRARVRPARSSSPVVGLEVGAADLLRMLAGEVNPPTMLLDGRLRVRGDFALAARIGEMFGGPSPY